MFLLCSYFTIPEVNMSCCINCSFDQRVFDKCTEWLAYSAGISAIAAVVLNTLADIAVFFGCATLGGPVLIGVSVIAGSS